MSSAGAIDGEQIRQPSNNSGKIAFSGDFSAADHARQHVGNVYNHTYTYTLRKQKSDETLRDREKDKALLRAAAEGQTPRVSYLLRLGADLDCSDDDGFTALHHASLSGFEDTVETLLAAGADVNGASLNHGTPLHLAALKARSNVVRRLLHRANVNAESRLVGSPLHCAAWGGDCQVLSMLIAAGADVTKKCILQKASVVLRSPTDRDQICDGEPVLTAIWKQDIEATTFLLDRGASVHGSSSYWRTNDPSKLTDGSAHVHRTDNISHLRSAVISRSLEVCELLLRRGARANDLDSIGSSALHFAASRGDIDIARRLLNHGAAIDTRDDDADTPVCLAAMYGHLDMIRLMLQSGADRHVVGCRGMNLITQAAYQENATVVRFLADEGVGFVADHKHKTPLHYAVKHHHLEVVALLIELGIEVDATDDNGRTALHGAVDADWIDGVQILLGAGADCDRSFPPKGFNALLRASMKGYTQVVHVLVNHGADMNAADIKHRTALMAACGYGFSDIAQLLLKPGVNVDAADVQGWTALMCACSSGHTEVVRILLDYGVDMNARSGFGRTAIHFAVEAKHLDVVDCLLRAGADALALDVDGFSPLYKAGVLLKRSVEEKDGEGAERLISIKKLLERVPGAARARVTLGEGAKPRLTPGDRFTLRPFPYERPSRDSSGERSTSKHSSEKPSKLPRR